MEVCVLMMELEDKLFGFRKTDLGVVVGVDFLP